MRRRKPRGSCTDTSTVSSSRSLAEHRLSQWGTAYSENVKRIVHSPLARHGGDGRAHQLETRSAGHSRIRSDRARAELAATCRDSRTGTSRCAARCCSYTRPTRALHGDESTNEWVTAFLGDFEADRARAPWRDDGIVSHGILMQAAWIVSRRPAHNEREMYRKAIDNSRDAWSVEMDGDKPVSWEYVPPPKVQTQPGSRLVMAAPDAGALPPGFSCGGPRAQRTRSKGTTALRLV